jgi:hypothetical protein
VVHYLHIGQLGQFDFRLNFGSQLEIFGKIASLLEAIFGMRKVCALPLVVADRT